MASTTTKIPVLLTVLLALSCIKVSCAIALRQLTHADSEDRSRSLRLSMNELGVNGIAPNGIWPNGIRVNGLRMNSLTSSAITSNTGSYNALTTNAGTYNGWSNSLAPSWIEASSLTLDDAAGPSSNGTELAAAFLDALAATEPSASPPQPSLLQFLAAAALDTITIASDEPVLTRLLEYTASCALDDSHKLTLNFHDGTKKVFSGAIGLAPEWAAGPLTDASSQELVSACLLARVNYFGIRVQLSLRGGPSGAAGLAVSTQEAQEYPVLEGAFWGNLFAEHQSMYACGSAETALNSYKNRRVCTTGLPLGSEYVSCGPIRHVGECDAVCKGSEAPTGMTYASCGVTKNIVTVYLAKK